MCNASCCVSSSQTQANPPALPVWFLPAGFPFVLIYSQGFCLIDLSRRPRHLFCEDSLFYSCVIWSAECKIGINYIYWGFVEQDFLLRVQSLRDRNWWGTHVEGVLPSTAAHQRCRGELGRCHIACHLTALFELLTLRIGCSGKTNFKENC